MAASAVQNGVCNNNTPAEHPHPTCLQAEHLCSMNLSWPQPLQRFRGRPSVLAPAAVDGPIDRTASAGRVSLPGWAATARSRAMHCAPSGLCRVAMTLSGAHFFTALSDHWADPSSSAAQATDQGRAAAMAVIK